MKSNSKKNVKYISHYFIIQQIRKLSAKFNFLINILNYTLRELSFLVLKEDHFYQVIVPLQGSNLRRTEVTWWVSNSKYKTVVPRCKTWKSSIKQIGIEFDSFNLDAKIESGFMQEWLKTRKKLAKLVSSFFQNKI